MSHSYVETCQSGQASVLSSLPQSLGEAEMIRQAIFTYPLGEGPKCPVIFAGHIEGSIVLLDELIPKKSYASFESEGAHGMVLYFKTSP